MNQKQFKIKADTIRWKQFSRHSDAVFRSLGREIVILSLSVATLTFALPQTSHAQTTIVDTKYPVEDEDTLQTVEITASRLPLPMQQTARVVSIISSEQIQNSPSNSINDILKNIPSLDVRQRGPFGIQTDMSINGGTHDQIIILINGVNVSSPHTGHLASDLPITPDDIERIEVLEGAASKVYGTSAFSGAINIITKKKNTDSNKPLSGSAGLNAGSFGTLGTHISLNFDKNKVFNRISASYNRSDGGTSNSDFKIFQLFYNGGVQTHHYDLNWHIGGRSQDFGANTFYSGRYPNQYEETRKLTSAVSLTTKGKIRVKPTLYWNRATDHYQLIKDTQTGENFHLTDVYGLTLNANAEWGWGTTVVGADLRNEGILSTSLGKPLEESQQISIYGHSGYYTKRDNRTNISYFVEHDVVIDKLSLSVGLMANMNTALDYRYRLYPGIDLSYRPDNKWKFFLSWNMAQRMPTFTDLYYKSPTQEGNIGLKPEKASEVSIAAEYNSNGIRAKIRGFYRHQKDMIDWIMTPADSVNNFTTYHAANFKVDNIGISFNAELYFKDILELNTIMKALSVNYTFLKQNRHDVMDIYASSYALDYLRHKLTSRLDIGLLKKLSLAVTFRYQDRMGAYVKYSPVQTTDGIAYNAATHDYDPYCLFDAKLTWKEPHYTIYIQCDNIFGKEYYDIGNVKQPGAWIMVGANYKF